MKVDYYVYYRVAADCDHASAHDGVRAMQQRLAARIGIAGRLLVRRDDSHTWMEVYPGVSDSDAFETALEDECRHAGVFRWLEAATVRHIERFVECA
ncbi:MAG: DUF4936 family protein [Zoogloeaceae bacterium]|nr:DUF4936 family protein [Zoogloeaceae bacterium]